MENLLQEIEDSPPRSKSHHLTSQHVMSVVNLVISNLSVQFSRSKRNWRKRVRPQVSPRE